MIWKSEEAERRNITCICNHCVKLWKLSTGIKPYLGEYGVQIN